MAWCTSPTPCCSATAWAEGMRVAVSGSGNVAQYTIEKALELDARVITVSDSGGTLVDEDGFTTEKLAHLAEIKTNATAGWRTTPANAA